ncbi:MAG: flavodoxin [Bacteroidales bacterium]
MKKILVLYWPERGNVEHCAVKIKNVLGNDATLKSLKTVNESDIQEADLIIAGCSTVGAETWKDTSRDNEWSPFLISEKGQLLKGKKVALFGLGDQVSYPNHFVDFMGVLKKEFDRLGATVIGRWPTDGYKFDASEAVEGDYFVGLALDEDWQSELTESRINRWTEQIRKDI